MLGYFGVSGSLKSAFAVGIVDADAEGSFSGASRGGKVAYCYAPSTPGTRASRPPLSLVKKERPGRPRSS